MGLFDDLTVEHPLPVWPSLSPRAKDAKVAEARGETFAPDATAKTYREWLKPYSASWEYAGPLIEDLEAAGYIVLIARADNGHPYCEAFRMTSGLLLMAEGESFPDAICLAYVLAKCVPAPSRGEKGKRG